MKLFKTKPLEREINGVYLELGTMRPSDPEYAKVVANLKELKEIQIGEKSKKKTISPDTLLLVGANIVGLLMVIHHEQTGIFTSKAMGMILKGR